MQHSQHPSLFARSLTVAGIVYVALALGGCSSPALVKIPGTQAEARLPIQDVARGRLLYETHCVACHDREIHWRDHSIVGSWSDLVVQVDRWQTNAGQHWQPSEIGDVAAYLNVRYYRLPCPVTGCSGDATARLELRRQPDRG